MFNLPPPRGKGDLCSDIVPSFKFQYKYPILPSHLTFLIFPTIKTDHYFRNYDGLKSEIGKINFICNCCKTDCNDICSFLSMGDSQNRRFFETVKS